MQLSDTAEEARFRAELRGWLDATLPALPPNPRPDDWPARRAYDSAWQGALFDAGYAGIDWPKEHGGRGASAGEHLVFLEECALAGAPDVGVNFVGLLHAGPTLIAEATPEQRARHLPRILRGDEIWCQGFSEPEAGSDLAGLRTRAVRDGDHYVVTGQKIWTSRAEVADWCELLVRTDADAPKHRGITWLIMPMDLPGIDVRPLRTIQGTDEFAELFLDEVRIPVVNRVGDENDGWRVAQVTFSFERGTSFVSELLEARRLVEHLAVMARGRDDAGFRRELGEVAATFDALWALTKRNVSQAEHGGVSVSGGSTFKLAYAEALHRLGRVAMPFLGARALSLADVDGAETGRHVHAQLHAFAISIAAGTSQIQRNILAERVLGLPREQR
jgi:alkylation response protein AidB-like acyl-CoA dehydrogenase